MSLRPRYSLLTLLVLTALVAGGVKLWRGPHRVITRFPLSPAEAAYFSEFFGPVESGGEGGGALETESIRDGWKERVLSIKSILAEGAEPLNLYTFNFPDSAVEQGEYLAKPVIDEILLRRYSPHTNRRIQRVIAVFHAHTDVPAESKILLAPGSMNTMFYITDSGAIFKKLRVGILSEDFFFTKIKLEEIPDPYLRARIAEELATLKK